MKNSRQNREETKRQQQQQQKLNLSKKKKNSKTKAFVDHYYATFDSNRASLGALYTPEATLSFEGQKSVGQAAILAKLTGEKKKKKN